MDIRTLEKRSYGEDPPPLLILLNQDVEAWDKGNLQQAEANKPLELATLHPKCQEASTRIGTRLQPKIREELK